MLNKLSSSALNLMNSAQYKVADAPQTIASLPVTESKPGSNNFASNNIIKPVLSLKEAEIETSAAVKILKTEDKMLGSLFDVTA